MTGRRQTPPTPFWPFIQSLQAAQVPVADIIRHLEPHCGNPFVLVEIAKCLLPRRGTVRSRRMSALCLVFGHADNWEPLQPMVQKFSPLILEALQFSSAHWEPLVGLIDLISWEPFFLKLLSRLGYPTELQDPQVHGKLCSGEALPWLNAGHGVVSKSLEMQGFATSASVWRLPMTHHLSLLDGQGPSTLDRRPNGRFDFSLCLMRPGLRLFRMRSLRRIKGLPWISALIAVDCPDLVHIQELPSAFVLKNCPSLKRLPKLQSGTLLHLEACAGLVSLDSLHSKEGFALDVNYLTFETVVLRDCPKLRRLPENLEVNGRMILCGMGPITRWPDDLRVGGNLLIQGCPEIQELPALRIGGSLRIAGASNLRHLSPGTTVGLHLDLRACTQLESIPKGIRVGGNLLLPAHLQRFAPIEVPVAMTTVVGQEGTHA